MVQMRMGLRIGAWLLTRKLGRIQRFPTVVLLMICSLFPEVLERVKIGQRLNYSQIPLSQRLVNVWG